MVANNYLLFIVLILLSLACGDKPSSEPESGGEGDLSISLIPPVFSLTSGQYTENQTVAITANGEENIFFTTNGDAPSGDSLEYSEPIILEGPENSYIIQAITIVDNIQSEISKIHVTIAWTSEAPAIDLDEELYIGEKLLVINHKDPDAKIYYTLDGSEPGIDSLLYTKPVVLPMDGEERTIQAIAIQGSRPSSIISSVKIKVIAPPSEPTTTVPTGTYSSDQIVALASDKEDAEIYYSLDGSIPTEDSMKYTEPLILEGPEQGYSLRAIAIDEHSVSTILEADILISWPKVAGPQLNLSSGTYHNPASITISSPTPNSTIYYTLDGSLPSETSTPYNGALSLSEASPELNIRAIAYASQHKPSGEIQGHYQLKSHIPEFDRPDGNYIGDQRVVIHKLYKSAIIYYTLDGSEPNESSQVYTSGIEFSSSDAASVLIKAVAKHGQRLISDTATLQMDIAPLNVGPLPAEFTLNYDDGETSLDTNLSSEATRPLNFELSLQLINKTYTNTIAKAPQKAPKASRPRDYDWDRLIPGELIIRVRGDASQGFSHQKLVSSPKSLENRLAQSLAFPITGSQVLASINNSPRQLQDSHASQDYIIKLNIDTNEKRATIAAISDLEALPDVVYAEPNYEITLASQVTPNDMFFEQLYGLHNIGQTEGLIGADINGPEAWFLGYQGDSSIRIGVIDTGVDYMHPDLTDNIWTNPGEIADNGIDDDNNGYIDDIHGYDFYSNDGNPMDLNGHGTHVSGTIAGRGNNGIGVSGVMWRASIVAIRFLGPSGSGTTAGAIASVAYANTLQLPITNNSWGGGGYSQALKDIIDQGESLFVAAAGNSSRDTDVSPNYPSAYDSPQILSVAASDHNDNRAYFSNYGAITVDLAAPGMNIFSTYTNTSGYDTLSGTSMASPHVAGLAGLVLSASPKLKTTELKEALMTTVDPLDSFAGITVTGGRINAERAIEQYAFHWIQITASSHQIPAGGTANLQITVDPTGIQAGVYNFEVHLIDVDTRFPAATIPFQVTINPCSSMTTENLNLDFGELIAGERSQRTLVLQNECNTPVSVQVISTELADGSFEQANSSPMIVPPFSMAELPINFITSDDAEGMDLVSLVRVETSAENLPSFDINASVKTHYGPELSLDTPKVQFRLTRNTVEGQTVRLSNSGDFELSYRLIEVSPGDYRRSIRTKVPDLEFPWQDISETGVVLLGPWDGMFDDRFIGQVLGFNFPYGENTFTEAFFSSHGLITFEAYTFAFDNLPLPSKTIPTNTILPFWDDLHMREGSLYGLQTEDGYVLQYHNIGRYPANGENFTFQIKLKSNGDIWFLYKNMEGVLNSATVGFQISNGPYNQVVYNENFIEGYTMVHYHPYASWFQFEASDEVNVLMPGEDVEVQIIANSTGLEEGTYNSFIEIDHNGIRDSVLQIPIELIVE